MVAQKRKLSKPKTKKLTSLLLDAMDNCNRLDDWCNLLDEAFYNYIEAVRQNPQSQRNFEILMETYLENSKHFLEAAKDALETARKLNRSSSD